MTELLLYVKALDYLFSTVTTNNIDIFLTDFTLTSQNEYYDNFILKYFYDSTALNNNIDTSFSIKHVSYINQQIIKLRDFNEVNYIKFLELKPYNIPPVQIRKKSPDTKCNGIIQSSLDSMNEQHYGVSNIKRLSQSQSYRSLVIKFIDIIHTYLFLVGDLDYDEEPDENEELLSSYVSNPDQDLAVTIKSAIFTLKNILLKVIMPISINNNKSNQIDKLLKQDNTLQINQIHLTHLEKIEIFDKYSNNNYFDENIVHTPTVSLNQAKRDIEAYINKFTDRKLDHIVSIIYSLQTKS